VAVTYFKTLFQNSPHNTEENHKSFSQDSRLRIKQRIEENYKNPVMIGGLWAENQSGLTT
jgi:hypothetical protein